MSERVLRAALERLLAVSMTEEEDVSPETQDEWIAAIEQANDALAGRSSDPEQHTFVAQDGRTHCRCGLPTVERLGADPALQATPNPDIDIIEAAFDDEERAALQATGEPPDVVPTTCWNHRLYDCPACRPRVAIEAASDEERRGAGATGELPQ